MAPCPTAEIGSVEGTFHLAMSENSPRDELVLKMAAIARERKILLIIAAIRRSLHAKIASQLGQVKPGGRGRRQTVTCGCRELPFFCSTAPPRWGSPARLRRCVTVTSPPGKGSAFTVRLPSDATR